MNRQLQFCLRQSDFIVITLLLTSGFNPSTGRRCAVEYSIQPRDVIVTSTRLTPWLHMSSHGLEDQLFTNLKEPDSLDLFKV
mmetsp:Transcript_17975/g.40618  ORF Transcript_17975/g.40618 Transcript_17975/m.40618 type:complete len:82 (+) Transcript_17975:165-410(+)